jgi:hypothetical protein
MRKILVFGLIILLGVLVGLHQFGVGEIQQRLVEKLAQEGGGPAEVTGFQGFLPFGRIWFQQASFRTERQPVTIEWNIEQVNLNLRLAQLIWKKAYVDSLTVDQVKWKAVVKGLDFNLQGDLKAQVSSGPALPVEIKPESLVCAMLSIQHGLVQGQLRSVPFKLFNQADLEVSPFAFHEEVPIAPIKTRLNLFFTDNREQGHLKYDGMMDPSGKANGLLSLSGVDLNLIDSYQPLYSSISEFKNLVARDWIESGSYGFSLAFDLAPDRLQGDLHIRLHLPLFGPRIRNLGALGEQAKPILDALEERKDVIDLGPVHFDEDLKTPDMESIAQIQTGMASALFKAVPGAAMEAGANILKDFLQKRKKK